MSQPAMPVASVWMITYNQEKYIAQAIESVISQQTTFSFDLVIGEDCSTDRTRAICLEYQARYPGILRVLEHKENVGIHRNIIVTLKACTGEYVALLEGDDYWTDPLKLQKQVDFLRENKTFVMCYQKTREINELTGMEKITNENDNEVTGLGEILERGWFMRTASLVFRNHVITEFPSWYYKFESTDYMLHILLAQHGKIRFLNDLTSVYRRHRGGITQEFQNRLVPFNEKKIKLLDTIDAYLQFEFHKQISVQKKSLCNASFVFTLQNAGSLNDIVYLIKLIPSLDYLALVKRAAWFLKKKVTFNTRQL